MHCTYHQLINQDYHVLFSCTLPYIGEKIYPNPRFTCSHGRWMGTAAAPGDTTCGPGPVMENLEPPQSLL
jgi:hypothetical protein